MSPGVLFLGLRLLGTVDRVEGRMAVIEWRLDAFGDLPVALLPVGLGEGDHIQVRLALYDGGPALALDTRRLLLLRPPAPDAVLLLPPDARLVPGRRYRIGVSPRSEIRSTPRRRPRPTCPTESQE